MGIDPVFFSLIPKKGRSFSIFFRRPGPYFLKDWTPVYSPDFSVYFCSHLCFTSSETRRDNPYLSARNLSFDFECRRLFFFPGASQLWHPLSYDQYGQPPRQFLLPPLTEMKSSFSSPPDFLPGYASSSLPYIAFMLRVNPFSVEGPALFRSPSVIPTDFSLPRHLYQVKSPPSSNLSWPEAPSFSLSIDFYRSCSEAIPPRLFALFPPSARHYLLEVLSRASPVLEPVSLSPERFYRPLFPPRFLFTLNL